MNPTCAVVAAAILPLFATAAAAAATGVATSDKPPLVRYVVRPGDTLIGLGKRALARPGDWKKLAQQNSVGEPRRMPAGKVLVIDPALLRREAQPATVAAFSGQVGFDPGGPARLGQPVAAGTMISTGANSFVTLALPDGSRVTLPSQSKVRIAALDRVAIDGRLERRFELLSGRGDFAVTPRERGEDRFLVKTPVAVAAVRGTEFRVAHDVAGERSVVTVVEGEVTGRPGTAVADTAIAAGAGAVLRSSVVTTKPLLPSPRLLRPGKVQDDPVVEFAIADDGAPRHHIQLARDAGFVDLFAETGTTSDVARFDGIGNATIYVRVTSIDVDGVEGLPAVFEVERFLNTLDTSVGDVPGVNGPRRTLFRWQPGGSGERTYDFVLARDEALAERLVDAPGLTGTEMAVTGLSPGMWYWRVTMTTRAGGKRHVRVLPVRTLTIARPER